MNDRIDRELRELFEELDQAAPEPPPPPRVPERRSAPRWQRALVPVGAVAALLLVVGVVGQLLSGDSEGAADTTSAGDATETTEAMDEAADTTASGSPEDTRPPGAALILADLNLSCSRFVDNSALAIPASPVSDEDHHDALVSLLTPVEELNQSVLAAESELNDPSFDPIAEEALALVDSVEVAADSPIAEAPSAYRQTRLDIDSLGEDLAAYGALDCSELAKNIP